MNNTNITIALSITSLAENITAECAWIDTCNMSILPPIVNPATSGDLTTYIVAGCEYTRSKISGYITAYSQNDEIITIELSVPQMRAENITALRKRIEQTTVFHALASLYKMQPQAKHICTTYTEKLNGALISTKQLLASAQ